MSYDLLLYRPRGIPELTVEEADKVIMALPHARKMGDDESPQYCLIDEQTDEGFLMDFYPESEDWQEQCPCEGPIIELNIGYGTSVEKALNHWV